MQQTVIIEYVLQIPVTGDRGFRNVASIAEKSDVSGWHANF
jgi:hypothetical protein